MSAWPIIEILRLKPIFKDKIWGGKRLRTLFSYPISSPKTGECWAISAHPSGDCLISDGPLNGKHLSEIYRDHNELFGNEKLSQFPLLVKIIDAEENLSIQVHPNDTYALKNEGQLGKTEAWIVLHTEPDTKVEYGHHAKTKEEFSALVKANQWEALLQYKPLYKGEVIYVPSGTLHALCAGTVILEIQQSSDVTYRFFDYNRLDEKGNPRDLHLAKAQEVVTIPHVEVPNKKLKHHRDSKVERIVEGKFFSIDQWSISKNLLIENKIHHYILCTVIEGEGLFNDHSIKKGDHFIITSQCTSINLTGRMVIIASRSKMNIIL
jgi:mannose-6-phosphate isomerase